MKIWMALDNDDPAQSGFGKTKRAAAGYVAENRGYNTAADARKDGWLGVVALIDVPKPAALVLLRACDND